MAKGRIEQEIFVKIIGGKDVGELQKAIKQLEKTKAELVVTADTDDARKELDEIDKQLAELRGEKAEIEVTAKVDRALAALDEVAAEAKKAEAAAEALSVALGPELAGKADLDGIISDFQRMGLSMDDITANADRLGAKLREVGQKDVGGRLTTGFQRIGDERPVGRWFGERASPTRSATRSRTSARSPGCRARPGWRSARWASTWPTPPSPARSSRRCWATSPRSPGPVAALVAVMQAVNSVTAAHEKAAEEAAAADAHLESALEGVSDQALALAGICNLSSSGCRRLTAQARGSGPTSSPEFRVLRAPCRDSAPRSVSSVSTSPT